MIEELNPWWFGEIDLDVLCYEGLKYKIYPKWIDQLSLEPFSLNFVIGPRRVGKTMGVKLLIDRLTKGHNSYSIFYFSCELLEDYKDLINVLKEYIRIKKNKGIKSSFIFLDEVCLVEDWWRALKYMIDSHKVDHDVLTILSSSSILLNQSFETFAGRMGKGKSIEVLPLTFKDFYELFYRDLFDDLAIELFEKYIKIGGYLSVLNNRLRLDDLISLIKLDIRKIDRSTDIAKDILFEIYKKAPSPFSYHSIAKDLGISVNTVRDYIEILKNMFLLNEIKFKGLDGKVYTRKEKKFVIRDPFMARAIALWSRATLKKDFLYEWIVQEHLYRKYGEIYYYRNKYEIDCISGPLKIEVKAGKPHRKYPKDVIVLGEEDIPRFLIEMFENQG